MNRLIRILYALEAADSGTLKHLVYLVCHLNPAHYAVTVIMSSKRSNRVWTECRKMEEAGATVIIMDMERSISPWQDLKSLLKILKYMRRHQFDIVHAHSSKAGALFRIAAWLIGIKTIIYTPHCFYFQSKEGLKRWCYVMLEKCLGIITDWVVVSDNERNFAIADRVVSNCKLQNINNAVKFEEYNPDHQYPDIRKQLNINTDALIVVAVGRLSEQKNWLMYLKAASIIVAEYREVIFLIVGDGELHNELVSEIAKYKLEDKIILTGYYHNISEIYSLADIVVSTSLWEGLPYVLLEAMSFKKPIIATDLAYTNFLQDDKNVCLVKSADVEMLADKLRGLISDAEKRKKIGEEGALAVHATFSFEFFIAKHKALYQKSVQNLM